MASSGSVPPLDLIYELQVEYNWDAAFAVAAKEEYVRWLKLRVDNNDLDFCKLPPSRVVAMVWSVHMLWTRDYANVCANLGGFVHSYPPAMRMTVTREQAYTTTLSLYKIAYGRDANTKYWGPSICADSNADAANTSGAGGPTVGTPIAAASASATMKAKVEATPTSTTPRPRGRPRKNTSRSPAPIPIASTPAHSTPGRSTRTSAAAASPHSRTQRGAVSGAPSAAAAILPTASPGRRRRSLPAVRAGSITKPGVLRPLAPGEKRGRGRPRQSEYVSAATAVASTQPAAPRATGTQSAGMRATAAAATSTTEPGILIDSSAAPQTPTGTPRGRGRPRKNSLAMTPPGGSSAATASPITPGQSIDGVHKRPRGRPRKDGSWPRVRTTKEVNMAAAVRAAMGDAGAEATAIAAGAGKSSAVAAAKAAGTAVVTKTGEKDDDKDQTDSAPKTAAAPAADGTSAADASAAGASAAGGDTAAKGTGAKTADGGKTAAGVKTGTANAAGAVASAAASDGATAADAGKVAATGKADPTPAGAAAKPADATAAALPGKDNGTKTPIDVASTSATASKVAAPAKEKDTAAADTSDKTVVAGKPAEEAEEKASADGKKSGGAVETAGEGATTAQSAKTETEKAGSTTTPPVAPAKVTA